MVAPALTPPLKWHGGKTYQTGHILRLMPPHVHFVEPFGGGLAVLLAKDPTGVSEVVNDLHRDLVEFWKVLRGADTFEQFRRIVEAVPFSEAEWEEPWEYLQSDPNADRVQRAVWFFLTCRQSLSGRMKSFTPLTRRRTRRAMNAEASAWWNAVEGLPAVHERLRRVVILNRPAIEVIRQQDAPGTLFYLDPPYVHVTRKSRKTYFHEMTEDDHRELLEELRRCEGKVILSGYSSELYETVLHDWNKYTFDIPNHAAGGAKKRKMTEVLWHNFDAPRADGRE